MFIFPHVILQAIPPMVFEMSSMFYFHVLSITMLFYGMATSSRSFITLSPTLPDCSLKTAIFLHSSAALLARIFTVLIRGIVISSRHGRAHVSYPTFHFRGHGTDLGLFTGLIFL